MMALSTMCAKFWGVGTHIIQGGPGCLEPDDLGPPCPVDGDAHSPGPAPGAFSPQDWVSAHSPAGVQPRGHPAHTAEGSSRAGLVTQPLLRPLLGPTLPQAGVPVCPQLCLCTRPHGLAASTRSLASTPKSAEGTQAPSNVPSSPSVPSITRQMGSCRWAGWPGAGRLPLCVVQDPDPRPWLGHSGHESCARRKGRMITAVCPRGSHSGTVI